MQRRALLAAVATGISGGCIERGRSGDRASGGDESPDAGETPERTNTRTPSQRFRRAEQADAFSNRRNATGLADGAVGKSARVEIDTGQYTNFPFALDEPSRMTVTGQVIRNGPIDCYVMTVDQFNDYQREPETVGAESTFSAVESLDFTTRFPEGDYLFVFDNTYLGEAGPSGEAELEFEFVLSP
ncbi:hypothetical protein [Halorientalis salina]|uniref:hypothetical protein n=1 Tax=Halorientalis salina TaxID=2932266 RepID=UPI0010ACF125|nr:hypothetical protein [Halorientalis salina]